MDDAAAKLAAAIADGLRGDVRLLRRVFPAWHSADGRPDSGNFKLDPDGGGTSIGDDSYKSRKEAFEAVHAPPESFYERAFWRSWPEEFTKRLLRVDRAINLTERSTMERLGCAYRIIFPEEKAVPAKPDWSPDRTEIVLREDDGTAARLIEAAYQLKARKASA